jgi:alkyl sulfatase BDS1-like metallo-beta-lactamase superfamily hydrolase
MVKLPKSLSEILWRAWYYGDLRHNVKAVYQFYLGAYDGNPANLNPCHRRNLPSVTWS